MNDTGMGMLSGLICCLLAVVIVVLIRRRRSGGEEMYDERQEAIRGRGYRYAYTTAMFLSIFYAVGFMDGSKQLVDPALVVMSILWISGLVLAIYTIWQGAYWGIDQRKRAGITLVWVLVIIMMFAMGVRYCMIGEMIVDGMVTFEGGITFLTAGFLTILLGANLVRSYLDRKGGDAE